ncbi:class A beta-lactamase [Acetobacter tropicalis]|uniref:class A beta-lactamase n=1 Tax=Acetobacter tropicalis TaxID=104102 RepID=UPI0002E2F280|nr:class A beta-lactamase [Acetobacter tropicalis]
MRRRHFLWGSSALLAAPAIAGTSAPTVISQYENETGGHVGFYAENTKTGATLGWRTDERFVMCSTFKASLAACVLARVDGGLDALERPLSYTAADIGDLYAPVAKANLAKGQMTIRELCAGAVEQSDNTCANLLLTHIGGPSVLTAFWRHLGDKTTRLDDVEPYLNRTPPGAIQNTTTPRSMAFILQHLVSGPVLSAPSRTILTDWLIRCRTGEHRLRAGFPSAWKIGDKTGNNGKDAAGDIAVIWPHPETSIVVCAYTRGGHPTEQQLSSVFAGIGKLVATRLTA